MEFEVTTLWMSRLEPKPEASVEAAEMVALLERAISGDTTAFEQVLLRHERRVVNIAWRLLGTMEDAQDAAQEVFLRTFKYLHRFDVRKPFQPWLIRMTVNVCRDIGRKRQRLRSVFSEAGQAYPELPDTESISPHAAFALERQKEVLRNALARLPEKERTALVLRNLEGFSTSEVAEILGSSEATVRAHISSACVKMRKALKGVRP